MNSVKKIQLKDKKQAFEEVYHNKVWLRSLHVGCRNFMEAVMSSL